MPDMPDVAYASWGRRFAAAVLDGIVVGLAIAVSLGFFLLPESGGGVAAAAGIFFILVLLIGPGVYHTWMIGARGQTLGKMAVGIRVVPDGDQGSIGYGRAFGRWILSGLLWWFLLPGIVDSLWPLWDAKRQTWHDKAVSSIVVNA